MVQSIEGLKFYYNNVDKFALADDGNGSFDLIAVEMTEEKFVPMFPCKVVYRSE